MKSPVRIFGILNITADSFSDGGRFLDTSAAVAHALQLFKSGAAIIDVGAAASNVASAPVATKTEISRLAPVLDAIEDAGIPISVDSSDIDVQRYALSRNVAFLNDVGGFSDSTFYDELANAKAGLIIVHTRTGPRASPLITDPTEIRDSLRLFFDQRIDALTRAGVARERLWLDPGMGLFLGSGSAPSIVALRSVAELRNAYGLPIFVSVSRKSFLGELCERGVAERGAATLAAELYAVEQGATAIRTHDPGALSDALIVRNALEPC